MKLVYATVLDQIKVQLLNWKSFILTSISFKIYIYKINLIVIGAFPESAKLAQNTSPIILNQIDFKQ